MAAAKNARRESKPKRTVKKSTSEHSATAESPTSAAPPPQLTGSQSSRFPIVGIAASAGGLQAFEKLFAGMPLDTGAAFVLIPHLDPQQESLMAELLPRYTKMPVVEAAEGMVVAPNHLYILPPNKYMTIVGGALRLTGPVEQGGAPTSIDLFLCSLADDQKERAVCIILSGTGSHGVMGLLAVKAAGGLAMVQDPRTAEYDRMPANAAATGRADCVLPVESIPAALVNFLESRYHVGAQLVPESASISEHLNELLSLLWAQAKIDFSSYRRRMLTRRLERRMRLEHFERPADYLAYLHNHPEAVQAVARDLLISVTRFFRDEEAFRVLQAKVIAPMVAAATPNSVLRVWVPCCSTGEEAFSIGMLLLEQLAANQKSCKLQIFGTDADEGALEVARRGIYHQSLVRNVGTKRLARFFSKVDDANYQLNKPLRECIIFARHNVIADSPFSKMHLISCRNFLIYLEPEAQRKLLTLLHFGLNDPGYLFLGSSETVGRQSHQFATISRKWRIYRRLGLSHPEPIEFPVFAGFASPALRHVSPDVKLQRPMDFAEVTQRQLLKDLAPTAVLIDRNRNVLYFFGPTNRYLDVPAGEATLDITMMARPGLRSRLRSAIDQAIASNAPVDVVDLQMKREGTYVPIAVTITPVQSAREDEKFLLVRFSDALAQAVGPAVPPGPAEEQIIQQLECELRATKEDLQGNIQVLEASQQSLLASNEEIMSMNEELQATNEELETSQEEMQSLNEELTSVNSQLLEKMHDLEALNNDLTNLIESTEIATVFLDKQMRINRFTPTATTLLNLIAGDVGRPMSDISWKFPADDLLQAAKRVLLTHEPEEKEVQSDDQQWYIRRILPYRTPAGEVEGVVVTLTNVTQMKEVAVLLREQMARMNSIVQTAADGIVTIDASGVIESFNRAAERLFGYVAAEVIGRNVSVLMPAPFADEHDGYLAHYLRTGITRVIGMGREVMGRRKDGTTFPIDLAVGEVREGRRLFTGFVRDISERKALEQDLLAAVTAEQQRIGHDLHDDTGQRLTAMGLMARTLAEALTAKSLPEAVLANRVAEGLTQALGQIRVLSRGLLPIELSAASLVPALQRLADQTNQLHGVACDVRCDVEVPPLDDMTVTNLYRIAQEAVTNAVRHAEPRTIQIHVGLASSNEHLVLTVVDDGIGLQHPPEESSGMGLRIMKYRARLIRATLTIERATKGGTIVTCTVSP